MTDASNMSPRKSNKTSLTEGNKSQEEEGKR